LILARTGSRRQEIAIRASLGARPFQVVCQLVAESVLLATVGGLLGIALANWILHAIVAVVPRDQLRVPELTVDGRVMFYALAISIVAGISVGIVPAVLAVWAPLATTLRSAGSRVTESPRIRRALVVCQVTMTVVLLCGAGLLVRTILALSSVNTGFDRHGLLTFEVALPGNGYDPNRRVAFYRDAAQAIREIPGVEAAAAVNNLPVIGGARAGTSFHRLGTPVLGPRERPYTRIRVVTPGYFRTLRIPLLRGREFTEADSASPTPGFIVNDAFAKAFLSDIDPLSASLAVQMQADNPYAQVIGVVADVTEESARKGAQPTIFYSHRQLSDSRMVMFARTNRPAAIAPLAVAAVHRLDPNLAIARIKTFDDAFSDSLARERISAFVSGGFALSGLLLAALGLYGLLAFLVTDRTREIGLRMALGAQLSELTWSVVREGLRLVGAGAAIGVALSLILLQSLRSLLFGVAANDATTYIGVLVLMCAVGAIASYLPARRAARVDPLVALRYE